MKLNQSLNMLNYSKNTIPSHLFPSQNIAQEWQVLLFSALFKRMCKCVNTT